MIKVNYKHNRTVLITGATGLLGSQILKILLTKSNGKVYVLGRAMSPEDLLARVQGVLAKFNFDFNDKLIANGRTEFIVGDITTNNFQLSNEKYQELLFNVEQVYHCAALTNFNSSKKDLVLVNVAGTRNVFSFGSKCKKLKSIEYISSIYVVGKYHKKFAETNISEPRKFNNPYEYSKYESEQDAVKYMAKGIKINIYRPSVIIGESIEGRVINPGLLYHFFRLIKNGLMDVFPFDNKARINIIPCDVAAKIIYKLSLSPETNKVYHVVSSNDLILSDLMKLAFKYYKKSMGEVISPAKFAKSNLSSVKKNIWAPFLPYLRFYPRISKSITRSKLAKYNTRFPKVTTQLIRKILKYYDGSLSGVV